MIDKIKKSYYDDILLILYDKTQSVVTSKKINQLQNIKENIKEKIIFKEKLEIVEVEVENLNKIDDEKIETKLITHLHKTLQKFQKKRIAGIIIITDGIIHDLNKIESDFTDIPIHFFLLGNKNERDRSIIVENIPEYALVGKPINFLFKISDENFNEKVNATFILDDVEVFSKNFMPNTNHEIELPISHAGANLLEIKINNHPDEITLRK